MTDPQPFSKLIPGFEFLQDLAKGAGAAMPGIGQWVAPTLDPDELGKRIDELRTVQFWLEQNAKMLATTVQALEVQRMTLATLKGMNVSVAEMAESLKVSPQAPAAAAAAGSGDGPDPMQWWTSLTRQFTELATQALRDGMGTNGPAAEAPASAAGKAAPARASRARRAGAGAGAGKAGQASGVGGPRTASSGKASPKTRRSSAPR